MASAYTETNQEQVTNPVGQLPPYALWSVLLVLFSIAVGYWLRGCGDKHAARTKRLLDFSDYCDHLVQELDPAAWAKVERAYPDTCKRFKSDFRNIARDISWRRRSKFKEAMTKYLSIGITPPIDYRKTQDEICDYLRKMKSYAK